MVISTIPRLLCPRDGCQSFTHDGSPLHRKYAGELQSSLGLNYGVLTRTLMALAGHSNMETTQRYTDLRPAMLKAPVGLV